MHVGLLAFTVHKQGLSAQGIEEGRIHVVSSCSICNDLWPIDHVCVPNPFLRAGFSTCTLCVGFLTCKLRLGFSTCQLCVGFLTRKLHVGFLTHSLCVRLLACWLHVCAALGPLVTSCRAPDPSATCVRFPALIQMQGLCTTCCFLRG